MSKVAKCYTNEHIKSDFWQQGNVVKITTKGLPLIDEDGDICQNLPDELIGTIQQVSVFYSDYKFDSLRFIIMNDQYQINNIILRSEEYFKHPEQFGCELIQTACLKNITVVLFKNNQQLQQILKKYPNKDIQEKADNYQDLNGCLFDYSDNFDLCLAINILSKTQFQINKVIQHELIHWMQIALNSETKKTYGLFDNMKFNLSIPDMLFLNQFIQFQSIINYIISGIEFEQWVANTNEEFIYSGLTIQEFQSIIKNKSKFIENINNKNISIGQKEMYLFAEICYLTSKNNKDNRYWYLIEVLKEN